MPEPIPISQIHAMTEREVSLLVVSHLNSLTERIDVFVKIIDQKVSREEYKEHLDEAKTLRRKYDNETDSLTRRIASVEDRINAYGLQGRTLAGVGRYFWIIVFGALNLIQFFYAIGSKANP